MAKKVIKVTVAKPKKGGAVFRAPVGTVLPTSTKETLDPAFKSLGYVSADGVTNSNSPESEDVTAWGGDVVATVRKSKKDTFKMTLIEALNEEVLRLVYGDANVTGTLETGLAVMANNDEQEACSLVIDSVLRSGVAKRVVIPNAVVSAVGDIQYADETIHGYETTLSAALDDAGQTHYEYMQAADSEGGADE